MVATSIADGRFERLTANEKLARATECPKYLHRGLSVATRQCSRSTTSSPQRGAIESGFCFVRTNDYARAVIRHSDCLVNTQKSRQRCRWLSTGESLNGLTKLWVRGFLALIRNGRATRSILVTNYRGRAPFGSAWQAADWKFKIREYKLRQDFSCEK